MIMDKEQMTPDIEKLKALAKRLNDKWGSYEKEVWTLCGITEEELQPVCKAESEIIAEYIAACSPDVILSLISKLNIAREALEFYADKDNWDEENGLGQTPSCWDGGAVDLGDRARKALEELK